MSVDPEITAKKDLDLETVLPIELIRQHTKTDDVPNVTDELLELYRSAAFEAAEKFTGVMWTGVATIQELAESKADRRMFRQYSILTLRYPSIDGIVNLFGSSGRDKISETFHIARGTRKVRIPTRFEAMDVAECCSPGRGAVNFGLQLLYRTGTTDPKDIPEGLKLGCLKYIAWSQANPGDELLTVRNRLGTTETGLIGTNDAAWASGAIETWRRYRAR